MSAEEAPGGSPGEALERHPSLADLFDPAVVLVEYDAAWPEQAHEELRRLELSAPPLLPPPRSSIATTRRARGFATRSPSW